MFKKILKLLAVSIGGYIIFGFIFKNGADEIPEGSWAMFIIKGIVFVCAVFLYTWQDGWFKGNSSKDEEKIKE